MKLSNTHKAIIETWMLSTINEGGIERYDDLHLDQIDEQWKAREYWIDAGLEAYRTASQLRDVHELPLTVAIAFSLESDEERQGIDFRTVQDLASRLDWSPPSLYLFRRGNEPWRLASRTESITDTEASDVVWKPIHSHELFGVALKGSGYFTEFKSPLATEYSRTIFLAG